MLHNYRKDKNGFIHNVGENFQDYINQRKAVMKDKNRLFEAQKELNDVKQELSSIKKLMLQLIEDRNKCL